MRHERNMNPATQSRHAIRSRVQREPPRQHVWRRVAPIKRAQRHAELVCAIRPHHVRWVGECAPAVHATEPHVAVVDVEHCHVARSQLGGMRLPLARCRDVVLRERPVEHRRLEVARQEWQRRE